MKHSLVDLKLQAIPDEKQACLRIMKHYDYDETKYQSAITRLVEKLKIPMFGHYTAYGALIYYQARHPDEVEAELKKLGIS